MPAVLAPPSKSQSRYKTLFAPVSSTIKKNEEVSELGKSEPVALEMVRRSGVTVSGSLRKLLTGGVLAGIMSGSYLDITAGLRKLKLSVWLL